LRAAVAAVQSQLQQWQAAVAAAVTAGAALKHCSCATETLGASTFDRKSKQLVNQQVWTVLPHRAVHKNTWLHSTANPCVQVQQTRNKAAQPSCVQAVSFYETTPTHPDPSPDVCAPYSNTATGGVCSWCLPLLRLLLSATCRCGCCCCPDQANLIIHTHANMHLASCCCPPHANILMHLVGTTVQAQHTVNEGTAHCS
jgi:hypothetical protein